MRFLTALLATITAIGVFTPRVAQKPCLTGPAGSHAVTVLRMTFSLGDSAASVNAWYPFKPANEAMVTDSLECVRVIRAFNALYPPADSLKHISTAYIAKAWPPTIYNLYWPATDSTLDESFIFDSALVLRARLASLK